MTNLDTPETVLNKSHLAHRVTLALYGGLILALLAETWWWNPPPGSRLIISGLTLLPLLLPLGGLLKRRPRSAAWLCFILCFYFISGVLSVSAQPASPHGWLVSVLTGLLFIVALLFIRWQNRSDRSV